MMEESGERKILIAMDGSRYAEYAFESPDFGSVSLVESVIDDEKREAGRELQKLTHILEEHNLSGKVMQIYGHARNEIIRVAEEENVAMIITGTRGMGNVGRAFLGSVSDHVLHHSHVPVLICRHKDDHHHHQQQDRRHSSD